LKVKPREAAVEVPSYEVLADVCEVPAEALAAAEEIAETSDVIGVESWRLEWMIRAALYVDRLARVPSSSGACNE
jgi:trans-2-enoyl-CoA reductase